MTVHHDSELDLCVVDQCVLILYLIHLGESARKYLSVLNKWNVNVEMC